ncbi:hypothetical protein Leryth_017676 [Lithospermum erythrorhizon]|nr:hypothetical protein Leryth_017676 [Lithospermum erythrorhizon]
MSSNPVELMLKCVERVSRNLSKLIFDDLHNPNKTTSSTTNHNTAITIEKSSPVTKEDLGRATWTFLHTLGAQYPDVPTRQQKRDVKELMAPDQSVSLQGLRRSLPTTAKNKSCAGWIACRIFSMVMSRA